jgi:hypothetical protein
LIQAYEKDKKKQGDGRLLPGLNATNDQLFFLGFAQVQYLGPRELGIYNCGWQTLWSKPCRAFIIFETRDIPSSCRLQIRLIFDSKN